MIRVADYIMKRIAQEGVNDLFYVPGGQCVYLCDALRRCEELRPISCHHEQAAAMAALGYAKYNNNFGACLVTTGCAGTNTMTGVLHAWQDNTPMIVVSGQQNYNQTVKESGLPLRQVGVQEADTETIVKPITKYAVTIEDPKSIAYHMDKAIYLAKNGRKGPVWIDVPLNVQNSMVDEDAMERFTEDYSYPVASDEDIKYVLELIKESKRPVILAGNGVRTGDAEEELRLLLDKIAVPTVFTRLSYDILEYDHPENFGVVSGLAGASRYANFIIQNSDLVISVGSRLSLDTTGSETDQFVREGKVIAVDIDKVEHSKHGVKLDRLILADAKSFLSSLKKAVDEIDTDTFNNDLKWWNDKCAHWKEVFPLYEEGCTSEEKIDAKYAMSRISEEAPEGTVFVSDAGFTGATAPTSTRLSKGQRMIHSFAQGEMGFSVPGAYGISAETDAPVVAYTGDGSFMMNLQELQTLHRYQFNVKVVIMNNNGYSGVRHGQKAHFRGKSIGVDPETGVDFPDFGRVAGAFDIPYKKVTGYSDLEEGIRWMYETSGPCVLEIETDPEQIDLHNGLVMYGKRKFGFRPIEDQAPYVDRDLFFSEMIIEPMETSSGKPM